MAYKNNSIEIFFLLVRAGLFGRTEHAERLLQDGVDWAEVYQLAKEQCVVGLAAEGIEKLQGEWLKTHGSHLIQKQSSIKFISPTLNLEKKNLAMNMFIAKLIVRLRQKGINALLIKGQAIGKCYEKPLWRTCGDVDLLLSEVDYQKAKDFLLPLVPCQGPEHEYKRHIGLTIDNWLVELHGSLRCGFSSRIDKELDELYKDTFEGGNVRLFTQKELQLFTLGKENDVTYVFAHFLNHFFKGGVGIRQICDWCRLLWSFRNSLDLGNLESRLKAMKLMSEWKAFGSYAVEYLGMPKDAIPFYSDDEKWRRKAKRINKFVLTTGNMGRNRIRNTKHVSFLLRKAKSIWQRLHDLSTNHIMIFPMDTLRFLPSILMTGIRQK